MTEDIRGLLHNAVYQRTNGRFGHHIPGIPGMPPSLILRTTGAKTGALRSNTLTYARDGQDFLVVASMGGAPTSPGWYHNPKNKHQVEIKVGTRRIAATAQPVLPTIRTTNDHGGSSTKTTQINTRSTNGAPRAPFP
jgi:deazaflavin-dependent oxidoreductase (nitroreductase family)